MREEEEEEVEEEVKGWLSVDSVPTADAEDIEGAVDDLLASIPLCLQECANVPFEALRTWCTCTCTSCMHPCTAYTCIHLHVVHNSVLLLSSFLRLSLLSLFPLC